MLSSRVRQPSADIYELTMGIIAWILLGLTRTQTLCTFFGVPA
jgi:hypothetical protein